VNRRVSRRDRRLRQLTNWLTVRLAGAIVNHMVKRSGQLDTVFHALAHDARRDMLRRLADRELTVGQLAEPLDMSLPAASKHVQVLEGAGLVQRTVMGRRHVCRLDPRPLAGADEWLRFYERAWSEQLDALARIFEDDQEGDR
jgi:DNA-binding transcriptional ArsR family regulator